MGLAGGPHCAAMCGMPCAGVVRTSTCGPRRGAWLFHVGRLAGYTLAGALAAGIGHSLAWLASHAAVLRPAWPLLHLAVLAWGLMLLVMARQPDWVDALGRFAWSRIRPLASSSHGLVVAGALWTFMPCGLLYSALLVASLAGNALGGALAMALFAVGSGVTLALTPLLLQRLRVSGNRWRSGWGTRLAGMMLVAGSGWALWLDATHASTAWCFALA